MQHVNQAQLLVAIHNTFLTPISDVKEANGGFYEPKVCCPHTKLHVTCTHNTGDFAAAFDRKLESGPTYKTYPYNSEWVNHAKLYIDPGHAVMSIYVMYKNTPLALIMVHGKVTDSLQVTPSSVHVSMICDAPRINTTSIIGKLNTVLLYVSKMDGSIKNKLPDVSTKAEASSMLLSLYGDAPIRCELYFTNYKTGPDTREVVLRRGSERRSSLDPEREVVVREGGVVTLYIRDTSAGKGARVGRQRVCVNNNVPNVSEWREFA